jgi:hypothetical protein
LSRDQLLLDPAEQCFGLVKRKAQHFQSIFALVEADDLGVADHIAIVGSKSKLELNAHGRLPAAVPESLEKRPGCPDIIPARSVSQL